METSLVIESVAFGGKGVGRLPDGKTCFVPFVAPGEKVSVRLTKDKKRYAEAELVTVHEASPDRVPAPCPVFGDCGGCRYQHLTYARQLELKSRQVSDVLRRLGGLTSVSVEPTRPSPQEYAYRNRISVHVRHGRIGFYGEKSRRIVEVRECPIASPKVNELLQELHRSRPEDREYPLREPTTYRGFRQVNDGAAEILAEVVDSLTSPTSLLVDAYCGAGFFARRLREKFTRVIGLEWSPDAIRAAREGASDHEDYIEGDVSHSLRQALTQGAPEETTLLLDPPAEGVDEAVIEIIHERPARRIVYVSCNPATLARDIQRLGATYTVQRVIPVDMFPQTAEIEAVVLLERL